ncbi:polysialyltransferase family glycosyltransferase [Marinobacter salarius]|uniref:polysialyltransferase family glycosyltransferase n=1 Tax=Marinobacter salarius TaxID=1420917 RepID=UPI003BAB2628
MSITWREYDLIGYRIVSPFHLTALTAFAQNFRPEKETLNLLIIVSKGPWKKNILKSTPIPDPRLNVRFIDEEEAGLEFPAWWLLLLIVRPFFGWAVKWINIAQIPVCAPTLSCLRLSSRSFSSLWRFEPVLIDEGVGSFNVLQNFRREAQSRFKSRWIQKFALQGYKLLHSSFDLFGGRRVTLFSFKGKEPVLNANVADSYRHVFRMGYEQRGQRLSFDRPVVLVLTQPFAEMGVCSEGDFVTEIERLVRKIHQLRLVPVLKTHPAEDLSKYNSLDVERVEYDGPAEEIFAAESNNVAEIWGFSSTSLIIGNALYGIRSRRVRLPWPDATVDFFKNEAQSLFKTYTEGL